MNTILLLIIAVLPIYLITLYVYNKDKEKEPKKLLMKIFIYGMLSSIPVIILELIIGYFFGETENMNIYKLFLYSVINIALVEEICKWIVVYKITYNNKEFDHLYDMVVYCIFASLGFAAVENILYVYIGGLTVGVIRALSAIPGHAAYGVIMANYLGKAKLADNKKIKQDKYLYIFLSILMPTITHGIYDYLLFTDKYILLVCFLILLIILYKYSQKKINYLSNIKDNLT